jgi:hypothetical protein
LMKAFLVLKKRWPYPYPLLHVFWILERHNASHL